MSPAFLALSSTLSNSSPRFLHSFPLCSIQSSSHRLRTIARTMCRQTQLVRFLSWNIDMDTKPITPRLHALLRQIDQLKPDIIMLQELTPSSFKFLANYLWLSPTSRTHSQSPPSSPSSNPPEIPPENIAPSDLPISQSSQTSQDQTPPPKKPKHQPLYHLHIDREWPETHPYFCILLTRNNLFYNPETTTHTFPTSKMGRAYISASGTISNGTHLFIATSHLESLKDSSEERKNQFSQILTMMRDKVENGYSTFFAGDTNLRESEVSAKQIQKVLPSNQQLNKKPKTALNKFGDAWVLAGSPDNHKFTWDVAKNDNLSFNADFKPRARYDRAFTLSPSKNERISQFRLVGLDRLECGKFISDHWGLCIDIIY